MRSFFVCLFFSYCFVILAFYKFIFFLHFAPFSFHFLILENGFFRYLLMYIFFIPHICYHYIIVISMRSAIAGKQNGFCNPYSKIKSFSLPSHSVGLLDSLLSLPLSHSSLSHSLLPLSLIPSLFLCLFSRSLIHFTLSVI